MILDLARARSTALGQSSLDDQRSPFVSPNSSCLVDGQRPKIRRGCSYHRVGPPVHFLASARPEIILGSRISRGSWL